MADGHTQQRTVLVADDDPTSRILIEAALSQSGLRVLLAENGESALRQFEQYRPDLVLLDVEMPLMDGFAVCRKIRGCGSLAPVVMVTGFDDHDSVARAYESGATQFISKPVHVASLGSQLRYILRAGDTLQELKSLEEQTRAMLAAIPDTLLRVTRRGHIIDYQCSPHDTPLLPRGNVVDRALAEFLDESVVAPILANVAATLDSRRPLNADFEIRRDDGICFYEARYVNIGADEVLVLCRNVTERRQAERRIHNLAYRDTLTGLPNRQSFLDLVDAALREHSGPEHGVAVLFLGIDGFKRINDTLGHGVGDHLLQAAADRLRVVAGRCPSRQGTDDACLARLGGDEFAILLQSVDSTADAIRAAHRVREELARPFLIDSNEIRVTASIGIAASPLDGTDALSLLKHADTAMYHSKESGRNNCQLYRASLTTSMTQRLSLENDLRKALERDEFTLHYQPQVSTAGTGIIGVEALIRWQHPQRGLIAPGEFIPVAEETGLIVPIGEWVLRTACRQGEAWRQAGVNDLRIAVNLSSLQFREPGLVALIRGILDETGLPAELLELELTEGVLMDHSEDSIAKLAELRGLGAQLSIDDFGTGYSSMNYLKSFPVNTIKIDRSFICDLPRDSDHAAITMAIIAMAHSLRLTVVAEGVETAEQAAVLTNFGCEAMQGFYYGRPMAADKATDFLMQGLGATASLLSAG